jgi:GxxExxY protein
MNADKKIDLHASGEAFPLKEETHAIIGCAFEVLNGLGHGLNEKCYENALAVEFGLKKIAFDQQHGFDVMYKTMPVGRFVPDLIAFQKVVVDAKVVDAITDHERGQMLNLNFKHARLEWEPVVLSPS